MKRITKLIALGTMASILFGASQVWAQRSIESPPPPREMRMVLKPDLYVLHFGGHFMAADNEVIVGVKVKNKGLKKAASFKVKLLYRTSPKAKWAYLQHAGVAALGIGEAKPLSFRHTVVPGKTYYYKAMVDYTDWVDEANEGNNTDTTAVRAH